MATGNGRRPTLVHDANLGLPVDDPVWREFLTRHDVAVTGFRGDMAPLTALVAQDSTTLCYLPAADYFALRDHPYEPIASAVYAAGGSASFASLLVVAADSHIESLSDLRGKRLGIAHRYCTSSYLAPAVLLHEHGQRIASFLSDEVIVPPYQGQIDAVLAGTVDATTVEEDVWQKNPANARSTRIIGRVPGLPTPVLIVHRDAPADLRRDLSAVLLGHRPEVTPDTLFAGFVPYQREAVERTFAEAAAALD